MPSYKYLHNYPLILKEITLNLNLALSNMRTQNVFAFLPTKNVSMLGLSQVLNYFVQELFILLTYLIYLHSFQSCYWYLQLKIETKRSPDWHSRPREELLIFCQTTTFSWHRASMKLNGLYFKSRSRVSKKYIGVWVSLN